MQLGVRSEICEDSEQTGEASCRSQENCGAGGTSPEEHQASDTGHFQGRKQFSATPLLRLYRKATCAFQPFSRLFLHRRLKQGREDESRIAERLGRTGQPRPDGLLLWVHAADIGEAHSALALISRLSPEYRILMTTRTPASAHLMVQRLPKGVIHQFVPIDTPRSVARFLNHWQPDASIWMETDMRPNLVMATAERQIPFALLNAHLTKAEFKKWYRIPGFIPPLFTAFNLICAQSIRDAARLKVIGITDAKRLGNLKYAASRLTTDTDLVDQFRHETGSRPVWLAAITHKGEEEIISQALVQLRGKFPDLLTIIALRHPERGKEVATLVARHGHLAAQRSKLQPITGDTNIYIVDTVGEMGLFYSVSSIVLVGGTLIDRGGHNPLEAASQNCALLIGPYCSDYLEPISDLRAAGAIKMVQNCDSLALELCRLLSDESVVKQHSAAARQVAADSQAVQDRVMDALRPLLPRLNPSQTFFSQGELATLRPEIVDQGEHQTS